MQEQRQPARVSDRIAMHETLQGRQQTYESVAFAKRVKKGKRRNAIAKQSRKKNR